jgi:hypothetical protein
VPQKVIHLNVARLARDIKAVAKAKEMLDDHDRAKLWDKLSDKVADEAKRDRSAEAQMSDEYWGDENKNWPGDPNAEDYMERWDGNDDGGS